MQVREENSHRKSDIRLAGGRPGSGVLKLIFSFNTVKQQKFLQEEKFHENNK